MKVRVKSHLETAVNEIREAIESRRDLSDPAYLRIMAQKSEETLGAVAKEHTDRLRAIADRIEALSRAFESAIHG